MARSGAGKVSARERARAAKAKLDAEQRDHGKRVEDAVTAYYDADDQRSAAVAALDTADHNRATAVKTLTDLNEPPKRIAALVGLSTAELRKLRRLLAGATTTAEEDGDATEHLPAAAQGGIPGRGSAGTSTPDTTPPAEPEREPEPAAAALAR